MKKIFFLLSLVLITAWIAGVFLWRLSGFGHSLLMVGILFYLRSMMIVEIPPAGEPKLENSKP
ncbi:MAG: hypothetical protein ABIT05_16170 [Chitinophagaceae bacterium]